MNQKFLVLSLNDEDIDFSKPLLFLNDALYEEFLFQNNNIQCNHEIMANWFNQSDKKKTYNYLINIYEFFLTELSIELNLIHKLKFSNRFWRIYIGVWLYHFIDVCYDRYMSIKEAFKFQPDLKTYLLDRNLYLVPSTMAEFSMLSMQNNLYNFQLYSKIINFLGYDFKRIKSDGNVKNINRLKPESFNLKAIYYFFKNKIRLNNKIILCSCYFSENTESNLINKSKGLIIKYDPATFESAENDIIQINRKKRSSINLGRIKTDDEFIRLLKLMIPDEIPKTFIEDLKKVRRTTLNYPEKIKAIVSGQWSSTSESFFYWAAENAEKKTRLLSIQHGGGFYGIMNNFPEYHERSISDKFYSWGWTDKFDDKVIKMPAVKMAESIIGNKTNNSKILWINNNWPNYWYRFQPWNPYIYNKYFKFQVEFFKNLTSGVKKEIVLRNYIHEYNKNTKEKLFSLLPEIKFEEFHQISFYDSLNESKLFICDHLGTSYLEALSFNKPTILFWPEEQYEDFFSDEAGVDFKKLQNAGILYHSPVEAAKTVNLNSEAIDSWWFENERQETVKNFCKKYALIKDNTSELWLKQLLSDSI